MRSILSKLVVYFSAMILGVCVIFAGISIYSTSNSVIDEVEHSLVWKADDAAEIIKGRNEQNYIYLEGIAATNMISSSSVSIDEKMALLLNIVEESDRFTRIGVSDLAGTLYLSDSYGLRGQTVDITTRDYFHASAAGARGIMNPVLSVNPDDNGGLVMVYSVPIYENSQVSGVLVAVADAAFLSEMVDEMTFGETGKTFIIDGTGTMIASVNRELVQNTFNPITLAETDPAYTALAEAETYVLNNETGTIVYEFNGIERYAGFSHIEGIDWYVQTEINTDEALAVIPALTTTIVIVSIIILLLGIGICYLIARQFSTPIKKVNEMLSELSKGHLSARLEQHSNDEIGQMSLSMNQFADELQNTVIASMNRISEGDVSMDIEILDDQDEIRPALKQTIDSVRGLVEETTTLSQAGISGQLSTRGDAEKFSGSFSEIIQGVNNTLDAVLDPLSMAASYLDNIGQGMIPEKVTKEYSGEYNDLKTSINACIDGLGAIKEGNYILGKLQANDLSETMSGQYNGIYAEIAESINGVQDQIARIVAVASHITDGDLSDLAFLKSVGQRSENDQLIPTLIKMIEIINALIDEAEQLSQMAIQGNLSSRGDTDRFPGEFAKVITGFNHTLDAVLAPIEETSQTLKELAQGNLSVSVKGDYQGDHANIKNDLNQTITFLKQYVDEITQTLEKMSSGDFNQEITTSYKGDFRPIKYSLNGISDSLSDTLKEIGRSADQVHAGAQQISSGGQALAQGTTEQASSIEELSASIDEVANETKQNAKRANEANELSILVENNAKAGNTQMQHMIEAMSEINDSSNNISKIIRVIDDIAFQTNILALNAAVEAARAGQHGKGFAVVAEEVRTLAARSAEAANETTGLIEGSIDKVTTGTKIADETAESLKEILNQIEKITGLIANIAKASNDQASEIAQVTTGIDQVAKVIQTNSATAEESAAASEELSSQAELLNNMVQAFKLKRESSNTQATNFAARPIKDSGPSLSEQASENIEIQLDDFGFDHFDDDKY
ncbi:methyl-accepting chemotaxis protein [Eubacteriaceae bacterium ES3]|nr:methyl-accepting chemotaxis protein [Eubacteriaceae bacterium ES3]